MEERKYYEAILTKRESDVMNILWEEGIPMTASEIVKKQEDLTVNTVQVILRQLLKRGLIEIGKIVYSGTVLCRAFQPTLSRQEFEVKAAMEAVTSLKKFNISAAGFAAALLGQEGKETTLEELVELEKLIQEKKKNL